MTKDLQHLVRYGPWTKTDQEAQFKMLELFVTEFDMKFSRECPRFVKNSRSLVFNVCSLPATIWLTISVFSSTA